MALLRSGIHRKENFRRLVSFAFLFSALLTFAHYHLASPDMYGNINGYFALISPLLVFAEQRLILPRILEGFALRDIMVTAFCGSYSAHVFGMFRIMLWNFEHNY